MPPFLDDSDNVDYPQAIPTQPKVEAPEIHTNIVDTRYQPTSNLMTWVEGRAWKVDYYSQVLGADNQLSAQQMNMTGPIQQYRLIKGMELKVTDPLAHSQDQEQKTMELRGGANVYNCLVPNEGDMFIADIGDGRLAVFQVTSSERKTAFKESVYVINYISVDYAVEKRRADLDQKVVETTMFVRDFMIYGQNPLVSTEEFNAIRDLARFYTSSLGEYLARFASREFMTLLIPGQGAPIYDHFLSKFVSRTVTVMDNYIMGHLRILNCDGSIRMQQPSLFDAIYERDVNKVGYGFKQVCLANTCTFDWVPHLDGIYHSGVEQTVFPLTSMEQGWDTGRDMGLGNDNKLNDTKDFHTGSFTVADQNGTSTEVPFIKPVLIDNYFVFSQAFYDGDRLNMSALEQAVMDYLEYKPPSYLRLMAMARDSIKWGRMEKFYYLPILYMMLKFYVRSI